MKKKLLTLLLIIHAVFVCSPEEIMLFRSNSLGMALEKLESFRRDEQEWVLEIEETGEGRELRRLFKNGLPDKSWERKQENGGLVWEKEVRGDFTLESFYSRGLIDKEVSVAADGAREVRDYEYIRGRLRRISHSLDDSLLYTDEYIGDEKGRLIRVDRIYPDEPAASSRYGYTGEKLIREWYSDGNREELFLFNDTDRDSREVWEKGELVSRVRWEEQEENLIRFSEYFREKLEIISVYDRDNRLVRETTRGEAEAAVVEFFWDGDNLTLKLKRSPGVQERWVYHYDGSLLVWEEKYRNQVLVMKTEYPEKGKRTEKTYRDGKVLAVVTYVDDLPVSTEFLGGRELP